MYIYMSVCVRGFHVMVYSFNLYSSSKSVSVALYIEYMVDQSEFHTTEYKICYYNNACMD